jgi:hypothetical protein
VDKLRSAPGIRIFTRMSKKDTGEIAPFEKCIVFLNDIGIKTIFTEIEPDSFLPGLTIENGMIIIDLNQLKHPGDILHEAGHIAVIPAADRSRLTATTIINRTNREAEEIMAIAWSYAVCIHLDIDPYFVFHTEGYKDGGDYIVESCGNNSYFGLSMLQEIGLTADEKNARRLNIFSYPNMIKWLRN